YILVLIFEGKYSCLRAKSAPFVGHLPTVPEAYGCHIDTVFRIFNEETRQPVKTPVARVLQEGTIVSLANHTALVTRDGREVPIADSAAPIRSPDGTLYGVVLVFRDFSERKRLEE